MTVRRPTTMPSIDSSDVIRETDHFRLRRINSISATLPAAEAVGCLVPHSGCTPRPKQAVDDDAPIRCRMSAHRKPEFAKAGDMWIVRCCRCGLFSRESGSEPEPAGFAGACPGSGR